MKRCSTCKNHKAVEDFYLNRTRKDGRAAQCITCYKAGNYGKILRCELCGSEFHIKHRNIRQRKHMRCTPCIRKISGERARTENSYILDKGYKRNKDNGKFQHRTVMEKHLGRELSTKEVIHHIDGDKFNNELSNLWLTNLSAHSIAHRSLEKLCFFLLKNGIVIFDRMSGLYRLPGELIWRTIP